MISKILMFYFLLFISINCFSQESNLNIHYCKIDTFSVIEAIHLAELTDVIVLVDTSDSDFRQKVVLLNEDSIYNKNKNLSPPPPPIDVPGQILVYYYLESGYGFLLLNQTSLFINRKIASKYSKLEQVIFKRDMVFKFYHDGTPIAVLVYYGVDNDECINIEFSTLYLGSKYRATSDYCSKDMYRFKRKISNRAGKVNYIVGEYYIKGKPEKITLRKIGFKSGDCPTDRGEYSIYLKYKYLGL